MICKMDKMAMKPAMTETVVIPMVVPAAVWLRAVVMALYEQVLNTVMTVIETMMTLAPTHVALRPAVMACLGLI